MGDLATLTRDDRRAELLYSWVLQVAFLAHQDRCRVMRDARLGNSDSSTLPAGPIADVVKQVCRFRCRRRREDQSM